MAGILREPLVHFALFAALVLGWFQAAGPPQPERGDMTVIAFDEGDVQRLADRYEQTWNRPPAPEQLAAILEGEIENELLVREALALGLDRGDTVIRGRLVQKMLFLAASAAQAMEPEDQVLQAHAEAAPEAFMVPPGLSFVQVYLGPDLPAGGADGLLDDLAAGADPGSAGVRSLLPTSMDMSPAPAVDAAFGSGFAAAAAALPKGIWSGPVQSGFGWHLVRLDETRAGYLPPLPDIREKVLFDWRRTQAGALTEAQLALLRQRYEVRLPDGVALPEGKTRP